MVEPLTSYERRVKRLRENYLKQVAEREAREKKQQKPESITEMNADPAIEMAEKSQDIDQIMKWLADESQGKNRKTVIEALETKMKELEGEK